MSTSGNNEDSNQGSNARADGALSAEAMKPILAALMNGRALHRDEARDAFRCIMSGGAAEPQIGALLALIQNRGATIEELTGAAEVMREFVTPVPVDERLRDRIIDTCGTGGAPKTFNISTAAAIVAAGAGAFVAKHGNRSRTGRGSAEVLEQLGVNVNASPEIQARCLEQCGVCFSFAIHHHPAIKYAMPARRALGFPTIYNLLGPLTNPAGATRQLLGVYRREFTDLIAGALKNLGSTHAMIVHGLDGLDEMTTTTRTHISELHEGFVATYELDVSEVGLTRTTLENLKIDTLEDAAQCITDIVNGRPGPVADVVLLNAGAALCVADLASDLAAGVEQARDAIATGKARQALDALVAVSNSP